VEGFTLSTRFSDIRNADLESNLNLFDWDKDGYIFTFPTHQSIPIKRHSGTHAIF